MNEKKWLERLMRLGFVANGIVYLTIGILTLQGALSGARQGAGSQQALSAIATEPFGQFLLVIIAIGMFGLTLWFVVRGLKDPDNAGDDASGIAKRAGYVIAGLIHGGLAVSAVRILTSAGGGGGGNQAADWTARLMQQPYGVWLVGLGGLVFVGVGIYQLYKAYEEKFREKLKTHEMNQTEVKWGVRAGRAGLTARGIVFGIIGVFLVRAAMQHDPQEAGGVGQALNALASQPYGPWLLGIVALGLIAFGLYSAIVLFQYRRIQLD